MKKVCTIIAICIIAIIISGCSIHPIKNIEGNAIPLLNDSSQPPLKVVQNAIVAACLSRGWVANVKSDNMIEAKLMLRDHQASVEIPFSRSSYSIIYKDSRKLGYRKNGTIHRNYNGWVTKLSASIQKELGLSSQG